MNFSTKVAGLLIVAILCSVQFAYAADRNIDSEEILIIADHVRIAPINPLLTRSTIAANLLDVIYDPLINYTSNGELKPALAKTWKNSEDGMLWTFELEENIRFHDGSILTSKDVEATYKVLLSLNQGFYQFGFANIDHIEAADDRILHIYLKRFDSFFPFFLNLIYIVPAKLLELELSSIPVIGTGSFQLQAYDPERVELVANDGYFRGRPSLDRIVVDVYPNQRACLSELIAGHADMVLLTDLSDYDVFANIDEYEARKAPIGFRYWVLFNVRHSVLRSKHVRHALVNLLGSVETDNGDDGLWRKENDLINVVALLKKEGWRDTDGDYFLDKNGKKFQVRILLSDDDDVSKRIVQQLSDRFEQIGIKVEYDVAPSYKELVTKGFVDRDYDLMLIPSNVRSGMPQQYLFWHSSQIDKGGNSGGYSNPEVDRLLDEIRYNPDPSARKKAEKDLAKALHDDPPGVPLFVKKTPVLVNKKFVGFSDDPFEFFSSFRNVRIHEGSD